MPTKSRMDKLQHIHLMEYLMTVRTTDTHNNGDELHKYNAGPKKANTKEYTPCNFTYIKFPKGKT